MKKIYLIGLPNAGKSTIFNKLTGSDVHTGNWHGVTVSVNSGVMILDNQKYMLYDLPGVYGLTPFSPEEAVTVREVLKNQDAIFLNVIDCNNLERSLNLTLQLLELRLNIIVLLNFWEDSKHRGVKIDDNALSQILGVKVTKFDKKCKKTSKNAKNDVIFTNFDSIMQYTQKWELDKVKNVLTQYCRDDLLLYNAIRVREGALDELWGCEIPLDVQAKLRHLILKDGVKTIFCDRKAYINKILDECVKLKSKEPYGYSKLDKIILNKYFAIPVFLVVMLCVFYLTFGFFGDFLSSVACFVIVDWLGGGLLTLLNLLSAPIWLTEFFNQAIIGGLGSVFSFLPQVILLFLFLEILEQSGYISRLAWLFEGIFSKIGLSGRSVFSLLMGFGCSTTAIPTTKTLQNKRARLKTILLIPFMSCSAKLPVFGAIAGAFFGSGSVLVIFGLYLLGIALAIAIALVMQKIYPTKPNEEILEFTPLRVPSIKKIFGIVGRNAWLFLSRIWTILLACTIIIWLCNNFTITFSYITIPEQQTSILESLSQLIAPIFAPLGFEWGVVCALFFGLVAKELTLSGIAVLNGVTNGNIASSLLDGSVVSFTSASCLAFLVFCLLYSPCISALIQIRQNVSRKVFWGYLVGQFALAYIFGAIAYGIGKMIEKVGIIDFAWLMLVCVLIIIVIEIAIISIFNKKDCGICRQCSINRK
ncbi:MAG: ferrous iron transport protein B [Clostridia bacterium]|nr:ferrous iron transport protein B [Clostridia bacterium]